MYQLENYTIQAAGKTIAAFCDERGTPFHEAKVNSRLAQETGQYLRITVWCVIITHHRAYLNWEIKNACTPT